MDVNTSFDEEVPEDGENEEIGHNCQCINLMKF